MVHAIILSEKLFSVIKGNVYKSFELLPVILLTVFALQWSCEIILSWNIILSNVVKRDVLFQ